MTSMAMFLPKASMRVAARRAARPHKNGSWRAFVLSAMMPTGIENYNSSRGCPAVDWLQRYGQEPR
jgi:hypothetical protein